MLYALMFVVALILVTVFKWNLILAAIVSAVGVPIVWSIIRLIMSAVLRRGTEEPAADPKKTEAEAG